MKKTTVSLTLCILWFMGMWAQKPTYEVQKASVAPEIDGNIDLIWDLALPASIDNNFQSEMPTLGFPGETYWKALWVENEGIYVLVVVNDDDFYPAFAAGGDSWLFDKPEIYFDCNTILEDGGGAIGEGQPGNGHHQAAPSFEAGLLSGQLLDAGFNGEGSIDDAGVLYAYMVYDPVYIAEYFFPNRYLTDAYGIIHDLTYDMGFDVTIIDRDEGGDNNRHRAVWANTGTEGAMSESWDNMDDCGILNFAGVGEKVFVESISLTGGTITENNGTLQIESQVLPADATTQSLLWTVQNGTGKAVVDQNGIVTAAMDGTVTVMAMAMDGSAVTASTTVAISNQIVSLNEVNLIRNGDFSEVNPDGTATHWDGWGGTLGAPLPRVIGGVAVCTPIRNLDSDWNYQYLFNQTGLNAQPGIAYTLSFEAWADEQRTFCVDFEDTPANGYNRYGATTDPRSADGRSEWTFDVSTEPTLYELEVVFDQIQPSTIQKVQFMLGLSDTICYIDNVMLVSDEDLAQVDDYVPVTSVAVKGQGGMSTLSEGETLQMMATISPEDASYKTVKWSVTPGTGTATIDENGLLTGISRGTVTVTASAIDDSGVSGSLSIDIDAYSFRDSLINYWPMNGTANDLGASGQDGLVQGATLTTDRDGNEDAAYYFDGIDDYIMVPDSLLITDRFTISFWALNEKTEGFSNILCDGSSSYGGNDFLINFWGNNIGIRADKSASLNHEYGTAPGLTGLELLNKWVHVTWTMNPVQSTVYLNGMEIAQIDEPGSNRGYHDPYTYIGARKVWSTPDNFFKGKLDDIRIYNTELDQEQVQLLYSGCSVVELYHDTIVNEVFDTTFVTILDTLTTEVFDTTFVTVYDTLTTEVFDTIHVTVFDSVAVTDTLIINVELTGTSPGGQINTLKVYPNPARDHVFIQTGDYMKMNGYVLKIVNQLGAAVFETNLEEPLYELDLSTWTGYGLYHIQVIDTDRQVIETRKIVLLE